MITCLATGGGHMSSELLIRPGMNDHDVVSELLAPGSATVLVPGSRQVPIDRLIVDAHVASKRDQFAIAAASAGIPFLIDPLTHFWQTELRSADALAALPYSSTAALTADAFANPLAREDLIAGVIDFQLG